MLEVKVISIEIPVASEMAKIADTVERKKIKYYSIWEEQQIEKGWEELPNLIAFIADKIKENTLQGYKRIDLNLADAKMMRYKKDLDPRIGYVFDGLFTSEMASHITEVFKMAGYHGYATMINIVNDICYRSGTICFYW